MRSSILFFLALVLFWSSAAQEIRCSPENREAVLLKLKEIGNLRDMSPGEELAAIGQTFLGTPYVAHTLEGNPTESLVVDLQGLDCTTYVENVLALGLVRRQGEPSFDAFLDALQKIRYRRGILMGYSSRLHYFTEWISDNEEKGLIKNITGQLGGKEVPRELHFMTRHRDLYPALASDEAYENLLKTESRISEDPICVLTLEALEKNEHLLASGDIIALATSIEGLDVTHTGFAIRMPDNRIHLLHASSTGKVEISDLPLVDYLKKIRNNTGVVVARPVY